ncbi:inositol-pentakisphosphate 2-kinase [Ganoderma leucocontextum]|nr:inositol-pentakisphosphate 2-kinase [Ganoderma leucocontextum]
MADTPHIADTSPQHWKYISEGGSSIVFSYSGPPHPAFDGTALRLRKAPVPERENEASGQYRQPQFAEGEEDEPDDPTIVFQHRVIERLVPKQFLPRLDAVRLDSAWLQELSTLTEVHRPSQRRAKDSIDRGRRKAVLATDLVGGSGWAVEIKPKWGFLPAPAHLSEETREIKTRTCRFCMHAHLKSAHGESVALGYCPLDLFSRDRQRVTRAVHSLWDVWIASKAAVNNLRVFVEGQKLAPTADLFPNLQTLMLDEIRDAFTSALLPLLLDTPVLHTLSTLQRTLDALDVEGLSALWARLRPEHASRLGKGELDPDIADWTRFVDTYLARHASERDTPETDTETEDELRYRMHAYLLSASFKDCSLILRMRSEQAGTITVIDLDVKGIDRLAKWAKLDREIVDAYRGVVQGDCVDGWASV